MDKCGLGHTLPPPPHFNPYHQNKSTLLIRRREETWPPDRRRYSKRNGTQIWESKRRRDHEICPQRSRH